MSPAKRRGLGRGLESLLTTPSEKPESVKVDDKDSVIKNDLVQLPIEQLHPGKYQPRKDMSPEALNELSHSIKSQGIIQPIVVRPVAEHSYEIIAGERRWRAAHLAELEVVPCIIKAVPDEAAIAIALIENIQREDLNAMEEAIALERLLVEFELTHQEVADAVGKSRTTVSNLLRLNNLNPDVKTLLEHGDLEMGHARALLALPEEQQIETANTVVAKELTVRETEALIKKAQAPAKAPKEKEQDEHAQHIEKSLSEQLGASVAVNHNKKGKGKMVISYSSLAELDEIVARFSSF